MTGRITYRAKKSFADILAVTAAAIAFISCAGGDSVSRFTHIPEAGWAYGDTVTFEIDSAVHVDQPLSIALRHNDSYPYRNIYIEVAVENIEGIRRDTVGIDLCDIFGHWYGHGIGSSMQIERPTKITLGKNARKVNLRHVMRVDTLKGIEIIGISGQPTEK